MALEGGGALAGGGGGREGGTSKPSNHGCCWQMATFCCQPGTIGSEVHTRSGTT